MAPLRAPAAVLIVVVAALATLRRAGRLTPPVRSGRSRAPGLFPVQPQGLTKNLTKLYERIMGASFSGIIRQISQAHWRAYAWVRLEGLQRTMEQRICPMNFATVRRRSQL
jgi:hypothetical protein